MDNVLKDAAALIERAGDLSEKEAELANERERLKAELEAYRDELREELAKIQALLANLGAKRPYRQNGLHIAQVVRDAVKATNEEFTTQDIAQLIQEEYPEAELGSTTISTVLGRMANKGQIVKVHVGHGSEPNTYRKP